MSSITSINDTTNVTNFNNISEIKSSNYIKDLTKDSVKKVEDTENKDKDLSENKDKYSKKDLDKLVGKLNKLLEDEKTHSEYSYNEDFKMIMIKIINDDTKETVLEIPPKKIMDMLANLCRNMGVFDKKA